MRNRGLACSRALALRQIHCELVEQFPQLKELRQKLRTAEREVAIHVIRARKSAASALKQTAPHPPR